MYNLYYQRTPDVRSKYSIFIYRQISHLFSIDRRLSLFNDCQIGPSCVCLSSALRYTAPLLRDITPLKKRPLVTDDNSVQDYKGPNFRCLIILIIYLNEHFLYITYKSCFVTVFKSVLQNVCHLHSFKIIILYM